MPDSFALPTAAVLAAALIALSLVWPQGEGARSPAPFGHPLAVNAQTTPAAPPPLALRGPLKLAVHKALRSHAHRAPL